MTAATDLTNQEKLEEVYEMTKENNDILRSLRRQQHVANFFRLIYWIVIIASLGGVYYYLQPLLDGFKKDSAQVSETMVKFNELNSQLPDAKLIDQIWEKFRNGDSALTPEAN